MALASHLQQHMQPGNWKAVVVAAAAGPTTPVNPAATMPMSPAPPLTATVPMNPTTLDVADAPNPPPIPPTPSVTAAACNPRHCGGTHHPSVPGSNTSSSKATTTQEA